MATTETISFGDGTTTQFSFTFPYIKTEDVRVELQEFDTVESTVISRVQISSFSIPANNPTVIQFAALGAATNYQAITGAPLTNHAVNTSNIIRVRIYRFTSADANPSTFIQGSAVRAQDLNDNFEQILYIMQERQNTIQTIQLGGIGENIIGTVSIQDDAITADKLRDSTVTDSDRAVTTNHIRNDAVTPAKLSTGGPYWDSSGKVGIGTTPTNSLHVFDSTADVILKVESGDSISRIELKDSIASNYISTVGANLDFATNGASTRMRIDASGNVGIGTASPSELLQVDGGNLLVRNNSGNNITLSTNVGNGNASTFLFQKARGGGSGPAQIFANDDLGSIEWQGYDGSSYNEAAKIRCKSTTNTGDFDAALIYNSNEHVFQNGVSELTRIDSSGRLLVGTSSASVEARAVLQAHSGSSVQDGRLYIQRGVTSLTNNTRTGQINFADSASNVGAVIESWTDDAWASGDYPGRLVFSTTADGSSTPTERMRITQKGGFTFATGASGVAFATPAVNTTTIEGDSNLGHTIQFNTSFSGNRDALIFFYNSSRVGSIQQNTTATLYNTSSDYRLKENVVSLTGAIDRINQLQVHRFNFIADPSKTVDGFIAHEAQAVVPECVTGEKDAVNEDGSIKPQGIDQSKLVPLLTAALQEALAKIETLEASNAALEARLTALEGGNP